MLNSTSPQHPLAAVALLLFAVLFPPPSTAAYVWDFQFKASDLSVSLSVSGQVAFNTPASPDTTATEANLAQVAALSWQWNVFGDIKKCVGVTQCLRSARWFIDNGELKELELHSLKFGFLNNPETLAGIVAAAIAIPIIYADDDSNGVVHHPHDAVGTLTETPAPAAGLLLLSAFSGLAAIAVKRRRVRSVTPVAPPI